MIRLASVVLTLVALVLTACAPSPASDDADVVGVWEMVDDGGTGLSGGTIVIESSGAIRLIEVAEELLGVGPVARGSELSISGTWTLSYQRTGGGWGVDYQLEGLVDGTRVGGGGRFLLGSREGRAMLWVDVGDPDGLVRVTYARQDQ